MITEKQQRIKNRPVSEIMTTELFKLNSNDTLYKAKSIMETKHLRHLPVVANKRLVGIISLTDILRLTFGDKLDTDMAGEESAIFDMLTIEQVMNHKPVTVGSSTTIEEVAKILTTAEFHALPVVDEERLVGIVTTTDVIKYLIEIE